MITRAGKAFGERFFIQPVGFAKIIERTCIVAQRGIHETDEEVRIHRFEGFEIHTGAVNKLESG